MEGVVQQEVGVAWAEDAGAVDEVEPGLAAAPQRPYGVRDGGADLVAGRPDLVGQPLAGR
ncbi:hypothetical protein [Nonomuraea phyllanthi]|uniref:hypothetical protein n=1 Tax=Nonomuraea phyllanthi TaxID=2219224 RepID=UPI00186B5015|nr:hypothetical protein [Nonomuraea phyllanthi]